MFHACVQRFDVMGGRGNILGSEQGPKPRESVSECADPFKNIYALR
jgi:hypothetical protein